MNRRNLKQRQARHGTITILAAISSIALIGMVAFCVDIGYVLSAKEDMQRSADSAALAACWEFGTRLAKGNSTTDAAGYARTTAAQYASLNKVTGSPVALDTNTANSPTGDVVLGYISDFKNPQSAFQTDGTNGYNAVQVTLHKDSNENGKVPFFFGRVFGMTGQSLHSTATAGLVRDVKGFKASADGSNIQILPYALDLQTWNSLIANSGTDAYKYDPATGTVKAGSDGLVEVNLFPQGTGSPGNRGTVDIGSCNNSTADIARQIVYGISPCDLAALGKPLQFDSTGKLTLNGDTGISAGVKDELTSIKGQPRVIPIFSAVSGNGNNAQYTIVKWQGVRIMNVQLTGSMSQKNVMIQVAPAQIKGIVPSPTVGTSSSVFSPVVLVR